MAQIYIAQDLNVHWGTSVCELKVTSLTGDGHLRKVYPLRVSASPSLRSQSHNGRYRIHHDCGLKQLEQYSAVLQIGMNAVFLHEYIWGLSCSLHFTWWTWFSPVLLRRLKCKHVLSPSNSPLNIAETVLHAADMNHSSSEGFKLVRANPGR